MREVVLDGESMTIEEIMLIGNSDVKFSLSLKSRTIMNDSRSHVESIVEGEQTVYGINTGFGSLSNVRIAPDELELLQRNLVLSHACGIGEPMAPVATLRMMAIRANSLAKGASGIRPEVVDTMLDLVNSMNAPVVPKIGSLGASGDLAPLAHMAMALIGEGQFQSFMKGSWSMRTSSAVFKSINRDPVVLKAKEGLSLINGTSQMCAYLAEATNLSDKLSRSADAACAMSVEAIAGSHKPFDERIHALRRQDGQKVVASRILSFLEGSEINTSHLACERVQDAYSFRCSPQVHGSVYDVIKNATRVVIDDVNSATDNPLIVNRKDGGYDVLSGGNFHGEPLALAADSLAAAIHELCSISERRINQMLMPKWSGLTPFLAKNGGLESGLMIIQYVSAAAIARIRLLAGPATLTNIPVSGEKEDHVSMGSTACERLIEVCNLASSVIASEMIVAAAALDLRDEDPGKGVRDLHKIVRSISPPIDGDRSMAHETKALSDYLMEYGV